MRKSMLVALTLLALSIASGEKVLPADFVDAKDSVKVGKKLILAPDADAFYDVGSSRLERLVNWSSSDTILRYDAVARKAITSITVANVTVATLAAAAETLSIADSIKSDQNGTMNNGWDIRLHLYLAGACTVVVNGWDNRNVLVSLKQAVAASGEAWLSLPLVKIKTVSWRNKAIGDSLGVFAYNRLGMFRTSNQSYRWTNAVATEQILPRKSGICVTQGWAQAHCLYGSSTLKPYQYELLEQSGTKGYVQPCSSAAGILGFVAEKGTANGTYWVYVSPFNLGTEAMSGTFQGSPVAPASDSFFKWDRKTDSLWTLWSDTGHVLYPRFGVANIATGNYAVTGGGCNDSATGLNSTVAGGSNNAATAYGASIGGGVLNKSRGLAATIAGGWGNQATDTSAAIGGGSFNVASSDFTTVAGGLYDSASYLKATVSGGAFNTASQFAAVVAGGYDNNATDSCATISGGMGGAAGAAFGTVAGGEFNAANGKWSTVGGGYHDTVSATGLCGIVAGGSTNAVQDSYATISGGWVNTAVGKFATISGGDHNQTTGHNATIPGGSYNTADGKLTFAGGYSADADGDTSFVFGSKVATKGYAALSGVFGTNCSTRTAKTFEFGDGAARTFKLTVDVDSPTEGHIQYHNASGVAIFKDTSWTMTDYDGTDSVDFLFRRDSTLITSDNPIKIGQASIVVDSGANGKVYINDYAVVDSIDGTVADLNKVRDTALYALSGNRLDKIPGWDSVATFSRCQYKLVTTSIRIQDTVKATTVGDGVLCVQLSPNDTWAIEWIQVYFDSVAIVGTGNDAAIYASVGTQANTPGDATLSGAEVDLLANKALATYINGYISTMNDAGSSLTATANTPAWTLYKAGTDVCLNWGGTGAAEGRIGLRVKILLGLSSRKKGVY